MSAEAIVFDIEKFAVHDGLGIHGFHQRLPAALPLMSQPRIAILRTGTAVRFRQCTESGPAEALKAVGRNSIILRCPLVPGINDADAALHHIADLANIL